MLKRNGIAYMVREPGRNWQDDSPDRFLGEVRRRFVRVIEVPGPGRLGSAWDWPLDEGARYWDQKADEATSGEAAARAWHVRAAGARMRGWLVMTAGTGCYGGWS
jgi:hypothetical protein